MQTKFFVLVAAMVCAVSMVANNKVSGVKQHIGLGYNADIRGPQRAGSHGVSLWGFRAMLMNPFSVKGYSIETKDLSALAPNTQHAETRDFLAHKGHDYFRQMIILNFHCNLDFGSRASTRENKRINNEDKENGILSGTK